MIIEPIVKPTENVGEWELVEPIDNFWLYYIPAGFRTDGASIPWIVQPFIRKGGKLFGPAVIHDYLYRNGIGSKRMADSVFRYAMILNEVPKRKRELVYTAVHLFGGPAWKGD